MSLRVVSSGFPISTAIATPLPVMVQGGEVAILEGKAVPAIWSGPHGYSPNNDRQVTSHDPGTSWDADDSEYLGYIGYKGAGATAADNGLITAYDQAAFAKEFPTARPGLLYGIVYVAWGNSYAYICDMYNASDTSTKEYRDRESWAYDSGSFCRTRMFEPKTNSGGMWDITFAKPIPFYLGLRVSYDNGNSCIYFLYSLDPAFA